MTNGHPIQYEIVLHDPQSILRSALGSNLRVLNYESKSFVKIGDNYGSTIFKVSATIKRHEDAEPEDLKLVAKMLPPTDHQRYIFESDSTFKKEIFIYENLMPTYRSLYESAFDLVPKFYGSRLSLDPKMTEVDDDAVILLEDLRAKGYYMNDRRKGLDIAHLKVAVATLAKFHAIGLSIKQKKPSYLTTLNCIGKPMSVNNLSMRPILSGVLKLLRADRDIDPYYKNRLHANEEVDRIAELYFAPLSPEEPWACLVHNDTWVNNLLFHRNEADGRIDDVKIVDFQTCYVSSPLTDLVFFLCTSMNIQLLDQGHFDELLEAYRRAALRVTEELGCDSYLFSKKSFEARLKIDALSEIFHILLMLKVVELRDDEILEKSPVSEFYVRRLKKVLRIYVEKKWL